MSTIPLCCNICPKKPSFSDISHLLTHIASKSHLSHYYQAKVRSNTDPSSRELVEAYDQWYTEWNVEDLMSERMTLKDKKRPRTRAPASRPSSITCNAAVSRNQRSGVGRRMRTARSTTSYKPSPTASAVDLHTMDNHIKQEPRMTPQLSPANPTVIQSSCLPQNHSNSARTQLRGKPFRGNMQNRYNIRRGSGLSEDMKENRPNHYNDVKLPGQSTYADPVMVSSGSTPKSLSPPSEKSKDPLELPDNETCKLKGILWPGMSLFDSATPNRRRRRNQKKDANVLEQLEMNSREVEATEIVWTPYGHFKKEKRINGMVDSSSSPWKSSPINNPRTALLEIGVPRRRFGGSQLPKYNTYTDQRAEMLLEYDDFPRIGRNGGKRKRKFEVWQDEEDRPCDEDRDNSILFAKPTELNLLTRGFDYEKENNNRLRYTAGSNDIISSKLPEDPFITNVTCGEDSKPQTTTVVSNHFNPFIFSAVSPQEYALPFVAGASMGGTPHAITETSVHGLPLPSDSGTGLGFCYGCWLRSHPQHQTQQTYTHDCTHTQSCSWAIAYSQLEPPFALMPTFTNCFSGISTSTHNPTFERQYRTSQASQPIFTTQDFSDHETYHSSPESYLNQPHTIHKALTSPIKGGGEIPIRYIENLSHVAACHAAQSDIEGMATRNGAVELPAFADTTESSTKAKCLFTNVVPSTLVPTAEVTTVTEYDEDSLDEERTITAPGTPA